jgi:hypothetical protein
MEIIINNRIEKDIEIASVNWAKRKIKKDKTKYDIYELDYDLCTSEISLYGSIKEIVYREGMCSINVLDLMK